jgi:hypothetical protein
MFTAPNANGRPLRSPSPNHRPPYPSGGPPNGNDEENEADVLPEYLAQQIDSETGLIQGRTPAMVMYLLMKAKHRYALERHDALIDELKATKHELGRVRDEKERALNDVLRVCFGYVLFENHVQTSPHSCTTQPTSRPTHWPH